MTIMENHHSAMEIAETADVARKKGNIAEAIQLYSSAFEYEYKAAMSLQDKYSIEPTRSIFFRSAASLALEAERPSEAERMIFLGLSGHPPEEIAEELRDLYEDVTFKRHLKIKGLCLSPCELRLSLWGENAGYGTILSREFCDRVQLLEKMIYRTSERKKNIPFRSAGKPNRSITEATEIYLRTAEAASFAVGVRIAAKQCSLPGMDFGEELAEEVMDTMILFNKGDHRELRRKITDEKYYENFVALAKQIVPLGTKVTRVGLAYAKTGNIIKQANLLPVKRESESMSARVGLNDAEVITCQGILKLADSRKKDGKIEIHADGVQPVSIYVNIELMADIVRPMYDSEVTVIATKKGKKYFLKDISRV